MNIIIVETMAEAHGIAPHVGPGWSVVHLGEQAGLRTDYPRWWVDPRVALPTGGAKLLARATAGPVKKVFINMPATLQGGASSDAIASWLTETLNGTCPKIYSVDLSTAGAGTIAQKLAQAREHKVGPHYEAYRWAATLDAILAKRTSDVLTAKFAYPVHIDRLQAFCLAPISKVERAIRVETPAEFWQVETAFANGIVCQSEVCEFIGKADRYQRWLEAGEYRTQFKTRQVTLEPPEPFTIMSLLDEANARWGFTVQQVTEAAMKLYHNGAITHPWTMGTSVPATFTKAVGPLLRSMGLGKALQAVHGGRGANGIVPKDPCGPQGGASRLGGTRRPLPKPRKGALCPTEHVYDMIWTRAVASHMSPAVVQEQLMRFVPMDSDRVLGAARGRKILDAGFSAVCPLPPEPELAKSAIKTIRTVERSNPTARLSERALLDGMIQQGVQAQDAILTLLALWDNGYVKSYDDGIAPSPTGEVISSFLERTMPFMMQPGFIRTVGDGTTKVLRGEIQGKKWVQGFVQKVLVPALDIAATTQPALNPPFSVKSMAPYEVIITDTGPYFYDSNSKDAINVTVGPDGHLVPFKARTMPGLCTVCGHTVLMLSRARGEDYIYCASCGAKTDT